MPLQPPVIGQGMARAQHVAAEQAATVWLPDDTERWLTDYPLPASFMWNGTRAYPRYTLKKGYGFWLRTAGPYHPALRGLFVLCHEILASLRPEVDPMPTAEQLCAQLLTWEQRKDLPWSEEDRKVVTPGTPHPGENAPGQPEPTQNPPETHAAPTSNPSLSEP